MMRKKIIKEKLKQNVWFPENLMGCGSPIRTPIILKTLKRSMFINSLFDIMIKIYNN